MKTYVIERHISGLIRCFVNDDSFGRYRLRHIVRHSPTGFECGYGGSGPADLALSILADHFGEMAEDMRFPADEDSMALCLHQTFKWKFIAPIRLLSGGRSFITGQSIQEWVDSVGQEAGVQ